MIIPPLYAQICSYENLKEAFLKARKGKTTKQYILDFQKDLKRHLILLQKALLFHTYRPKKLESFIIRDPKIRKISKSAFQDRVVHHALCNVIEPLFEKVFIYDSYANRVGKGTLKAIERLQYFTRKASKNNTRRAYVFKADIRKYFETVDHAILLDILKKKIKDKRTLWLIKTILSNYYVKEKGKGMPLGNLTSQFFANVYMNDLDQFVKHKLRAKKYVRYVDDFVIVSRSRKELEMQKNKIDIFLKQRLHIELHPDKSKIIPFHRGVEFLGMKVFLYHKLIIRKNRRKFKRKFKIMISEYNESFVDYDAIYDSVEGWLAYARNANTFKMRTIILKEIEEKFRGEVSSKDIDRYIKKLPK